VALGAKVHIDTDLADQTFIPMGFIAYGRPGCLYPPDQAPQVHEQLSRLGFMRYVFGIDGEGKTRAEIMDEVMSKYTRSLAEYRDDHVVDADV
jgi:hypothetical protein